jgi:hypothetical protein
MNNDSPPKEYKYKLKAEDFEKLFLANDDEFEELKLQLLGTTEINIKREDRFTKLENTEIAGELIIHGKKINNCVVAFLIYQFIAAFRKHTKKQ